MYSNTNIASLPWLTTLLTILWLSVAYMFHSRWGRDVSQWPMDLPARSYTFTDHPHLRDFDDAVAAEHWGGMVRHEWWDTEWRDESGRRFPRGIDVFHKVHCLVAIRDDFAIMASSPDRGEKPDFRKKRAEERTRRKVELTVNQNHLQHCFDFLRQDILCAADMTLEPLPDGYVETDGRGVEHVCKDWRVLLELMDLPDEDEI
ncbi:Uu.00g134780.m01.CDS01 [Anthostomella pinea]|uniref:Uu.00g134780.m01.CDS01 n=1 Tax=Anthostomella pinea TaxID=933095 RepID=A0AAI8VP03_9PEZI|nr:Uu.00g134780.m01.CDS01 [Anthostomella pinea]